MTTNELIEQIGGRERLEALASFRPSGSNTVNSASRDEWMAMASALLAMLDAQGEPAAWIINCNSARINFAETEKTCVDKIIEECRENGTDIDVTPLYKTPPAASVPEGWKVVPVEPTWSMLSADGCSKHHGGQECLHHENRKRIWSAMLAAAPAPGGEK